MKGDKSFNLVALPVFSVDTEAQAKSIQVRFGRHQYESHPLIPGRPWYRWTDFDGELDSLRGITMKCRQWYEGYILPKGIK